MRNNWILQDDYRRIMLFIFLILLIVIFKWDSRNSQIDASHRPDTFYDNSTCQDCGQCQGSGLEKFKVRHPTDQQAKAISQKQQNCSTNRHQYHNQQHESQYENKQF